MAAYDEQAAPMYEANIVPRFRPVAERLVDLAAPQPGQKVLELAGGTGGLARLVAPAVGPGGHVVMSDLSAPMLGVASGVLQDLGIRNVILARADLADLPFPPGQFDLVAAQMSPVAEKAAFLRAAAAQLRPGGRLAIALWGGGLYSEVTLHNRVRALMRLGRLPPSVTPREAAAKLRRLGLGDVAAMEESLDNEWPAVEDYITYRRSFGGPALPAAARARYYRILEQETRRLAGDGPVRLGWRVGYVVATAPY